MGKKEEILNCALELFNSEGLDNITTRNISTKLGISPGNLTYHFKKKDEIIHSLYLKLVEELSIIFEHQLNSKISIQSIYEGTHFLYSTLLKYKFCMVDFVQLMRTQPKIKAHFNALMEHRKTQFLGLFQKCIESEIMIPEEFPGQYQSVGLTMSLHGDYWLSHSEVLFKGNDQLALDTYVKNLMVLLFPYLTEQAKVEMKNLLKNSPR